MADKPLKPIKPGSVMTRQLAGLFSEFLENERASGIILIVCTGLSIALANSFLGDQYLHFWHLELFGTSLQHWINDGLMAVFFLLIGLEIERELYIGELSDPKNASLPIAAAIGGMVTPALLHYLFNQGTATAGGAGIPMATDIAFALGVLTLLGRSVPVSLKVFLSAFAIIDDLGAILVIALFYVSDFSAAYFGSSLVIFAVLLLLNRNNVDSLALYLGLGCVMWYFMLQSGVHATVAGVLLAFAIPFRRLGDHSPSHRLQHLLHRPVAFVIMPLFALANTGIALSGESFAGLASANSLGIAAGLLIGKPFGIALFSYFAVKSGISRLSDEVSWRHIIGAGFLGGIGFTMSIFITLLAFNNPEIIETSKLSILITSALAGTIGYLFLKERKGPEHAAR